MNFDELKGAYKQYVHHKSMSNLVAGIENRYGVVESVVHQFARHGLGYTGDPSLFTGHLGNLKHESVLQAISKSSPYVNTKMSVLDQLLNITVPIATAGYVVYTMNQQQEQYKKNLNTELPESETEKYLTSVISPPVTSDLE